MYAPTLLKSIHGKETMPSSAVMSPPILNEMYFGARLEKSNDGETTFAAMLVEIWAIAMTIMAIMRSMGRSVSRRVTRATGGQIASSNTTMVAAVTAIPINENAVIVSGRPMAWPTTCERWLLA